MDGPRMLSGSELVSKGVSKKIDVKLPALGNKDVCPSGSWLEQKQIQSALEAHKHLIEVERIEKNGSLSHALWRDDINLAEVTHKTGGHWQYLGHNVGKHLYLLPEETLFLMETNCLLLKHNDVTVSLQKAYSLCLSDIPIGHYKVYASLSRLGYRVFRHKHIEGKPPDDKSASEHIQIVSGTHIANSPAKNNKDDTSISNGAHNVVSIVQYDNIMMETDKDDTKAEIEICMAEDTLQSNTIDASIETNGSNKETSVIDRESNQLYIDSCENGNNISKTDSIVDENVDTNNIDQKNIKVNHESTIMTISIKEDIQESPVVYSVDELGVIRTSEGDISMKITSKVSESSKTCPLQTIGEESGSGTNDSSKHFETETNYFDARMQKLIERKSNITKNLEALNAMQDFYQKRLVSVNVPDEKYLPRSVFLHKAAYVLNVDLVRNHNATNTNASSDEMDIIMPHTQESPSANSSTAPTVEASSQNFPNQQFNSHSYRSYSTYFRPPWAQQNNFNTYFGYNMYRSPPPFYVHPKFRYQSQPFIRNHYTNFQAVPNVSSSSQNYQHQSKRNNMKIYHYNMITNIANRFKRSMHTQTQVRALQSLLNTYNKHYDQRVELTSDFNIIDMKMENKINEQLVQEVIVLDDEPKPKKARLNDDSETMKQNLEKLRTLAAKLKKLQIKNLAVSRHRRVFSNAVKTFNKFFNADIYLDSDFEIKDRKLIVIDSSSDSDTVVAVDNFPVKGKDKPKKRKKLRNPYSILKLCSTNGNDTASQVRKFESQKVPTLQSLSLIASNKIAISNHNSVCEDNSVSPIPDYNDVGLLKYFNAAWLPSEDDFGRAELCSRVQARLDSHIFEPEYLNEVLKESTEFENWLELKVSVLKDMQHTLELQKRQAETLSNDFLEIGHQIQPIVQPNCCDLRSALKQLAVIPTNKHVPADSTLRIDYDVCNRDVNIKKTNLPKPNFRIICTDGSAPFPSIEDVVSLQSKYTDGIPTVFAFVFTDTISYLRYNQIDLPVYIPDELAAAE